MIGNPDVLLEQKDGTQDGDHVECFVKATPNPLASRHPLTPHYPMDRFG